MSVIGVCYSSGPEQFVFLSILDKVSYMLFKVVKFI